MTATSLVDVVVPDIGDFADVPVIEILVGEGDTVALDDPLVTLESDKATMDVPAPAEGRVRDLQVKVGDSVSEGTLLMRLEPAEQPEEAEVAGEPTAESDTGGEAPQPSASAENAPEPSASAESAPEPSASAESAPEPDRGTEPESQPAEPPAAANGGGPVYASPSVRRIARELGVDLSRVNGSGRKGRITKEDVESAASGGGTDGDGAQAGAPASTPPAGTGLEGLALAPWPKVNFEKFGPVERVERTRIQKISAPNLARNWVMIPHVTHNDEADITDLEAWRKELNREYEREGVKLTMVGFLVAACVATLKAFPHFNASLDGDALVLRRYYNIGFAADTPNGLVVPVIRDADQLGLIDIARRLTELSGSAREGKLKPADIQGSTFTISSLGGIGGTSFTPIINAPEVAILGVTRAAMKPVWDGSEFVPRLMVPLSLSYDHRVIDGADAARFVAHLVRVISDLRRILL